MIAGLISLSEIIDKRGGKTIFVYGREAHAMQPSKKGEEDNWPLLSSLAMPEQKVARIEKQHSTNMERQQACNTFLSWFPHLKETKIKMVIDPVKGDFEKLFNPWPARLLVFKNEKNNLILSYKSYFESDGTIDFKRFSDFVLENF